MTDEYEYEQMEEEETKVAGFAREGGGKTLPEGVMLRLKMHSERVGESIEKVEKFYLDSIRDEYGCEDWADEDEDLLVDWSEQILVQTRRATIGGGANTVTFVGCFIGVDGTKRDRRQAMRNRAAIDFTRDPNAAIDSGKIGVYEKNGDTWKITTANGSIDTVEPVDEPPVLGFLADGQYICLVGSSTGRPMPSTLMGRHYYFLGNEEEKFEQDIKMWRVDCVGDAADIEVKIGEPCKIFVRPPNENAPDAYKDILGISAGFEDSIDYTYDFVGEDEKKFLHPGRFLVNPDMHPFYAPLEDLEEAYESGSRTFEINGEQGRAGPIVITKGTVTRLSTEPRETEYDESGRNYVFNLTSVALQSQYGQSNASEVACWVSSACHDNSKPFIARDDVSEIEWAEKSTVYVIGRIGMSVRDGERNPKLTVFGVYADPRRIRRRVSGGNTGQEQFN